jgi:hypothetical protein
VKLASLEREHMHALHTLEATFEKRLKLQQTEMYAQITTRDDQQLHVEEAMSRVHQACAGAGTKLHLSVQPQYLCILFPVVCFTEVVTNV